MTQHIIRFLILIDELTFTHLKGFLKYLINTINLTYCTLPYPIYSNTTWHCRWFWWGGRCFWYRRSGSLEFVERVKLLMLTILFSLAKETNLVTLCQDFKVPSLKYSLVTSLILISTRIGWQYSHSSSPKKCSIRCLQPLIVLDNCTSTSNGSQRLETKCKRFWDPLFIWV